MNTQPGKIRWLIGVAMIGTALTLGLGGLSISAKETWQMGDYENGEHADRPRTAFEQDAVYIEECGACHLAYPPGLLPAESWRAMMAGLEDHFGENAELDQETASHISSYLDRQALQKGKPSPMSKMLRNLAGKPPLRITELPYFIHEHDEIPKRMVTENPDVGSLSQCDRCHKEAARGSFDEDRVFIPGFGRWDD